MTRELLTFEIAQQLFGLDMAAIREIRAWSPMMRLPGMAPDLAGIVAWGGVLLPILDLGARLGWGATRASKDNTIILVQTGPQMAGFLIGSLADPLLLEEASLQSPPSLGMEDIARFIDGLAPVGNRMLLVLNLEEMLDGWKRNKAA